MECEGQAKPCQSFLNENRLSQSPPISFGMWLLQCIDLDNMSICNTAAIHLTHLQAPAFPLCLLITFTFWEKMAICKIKQKLSFSSFEWLDSSLCGKWKHTGWLLSYSLVYPLSYINMYLLTQFYQIIFLLPP